MNVMGNEEKRDMLMRKQIRKKVKNMGIDS